MPFTKDQLEQMVGGTRSSTIPPFCTGCGYDLTGAVSDRCPECGQVFVAREWRQYAAHLQQQLKELEEAGRWVRAAHWIAGVGVALVFAGFFAPASCFQTVVRSLAGLCGFVAVFLSLNLFRVGRLPPWARESLSVSKRYHGPAFVTIVAGVAVVATAILVL
jgi:predicted RNA-binding Zn-ribbon protein involved in translation (DUF1610 family)